MQAARFAGPGEALQLQEVPRPQPGPDEVLVRVRAAGVCATELHFTEGLLAPARTPMTLGHEVAGTVEEVGQAVADWVPGDRVAVHYLHTCGNCRQCRRGRENLCTAPRGMLAFASDGGFAEHLAVPARSLARIPDAVSFSEAAPVACSVATALHAAAIAAVGADDVAVVYGTGGVGLALVQVLRHRGARVVAVARSARRRALAAELGAEWTLDPADGDVGEQVQRLCGGADAVFELVGTADSGRQALAALDRAGALVYVGYSAERVELNPVQLVVPEQRILTSVSNTMAELELGLELVARGIVRSVVDREEPLGAVNDVLGALARGEVVGRAVLLP